MPIDLFWALLLFVTAMTVTPGPNNTILLASGVNFGFRASIPLVAGIAFGLASMVALIGFGLGQVFEAYPWILKALSWAGGAYMLYLAWMIATSGPIRKDGEGAGRPFSFLGAAGFQWINPKAWVMSVYAVSTYTVPQNYLPTLAIVLAVLLGIGITSCSSWAAFGAMMRRWLEDPVRLRIFNITMALFLVLSLLPLLRH
jgi:threonine/homoserine/homoserine lactone efflux protein